MHVLLSMLHTYLHYCSRWQYNDTVSVSWCRRYAHVTWLLTAQPHCCLGLISIFPAGVPCCEQVGLITSIILSLQVAFVKTDVGVYIFPAHLTWTWLYLKAADTPALSKDLPSPRTRHSVLMTFSSQRTSILCTQIVSSSYWTLTELTLMLSRNPL